MNQNPLFVPVLSAARLILAMSLLVSCDDPSKTTQPHAQELHQEGSGVGKSSIPRSASTADRQQASQTDRIASEETRTAQGEKPEDIPFICGGETTRASVDRYFADLRSALAVPAPGRRFDVFVADRFAVTDAQGKQVWFTPKDSASGSSDTITRKEWNEISARGTDSLNDAGWRGCFIDEGKVWLQADAENGLKLTAISRAMPWIEAPARK